MIKHVHIAYFNVGQADIKTTKGGGWRTGKSQVESKTLDHEDIIDYLNPIVVPPATDPESKDTNTGPKFAPNALL